MLLFKLAIDVYESYYKNFGAPLFDVTIFSNLIYLDLSKRSDPNGA
jgi:hypothetical protein